MLRLSVIICTYNPRAEIFRECLDHLSLAASQLQPCEVIIVDNNSGKPLVNEDYIKTFLSAASYAKIVTEKRQGLTPARLRGIKESSGDLLVFIDDDNFVDENFFVAGVKIAEQCKEIGSWSGQVKLRFEVNPPLWTRRYWGLLVYREFERDLWSNLPHLSATMPCGAGLFARRSVVEQYIRLHESGERSIQLDRTAGSLFSAGDNDLAACACDIGLGVGIFSSLVLYHFIPANRITKGYLLRLAEGIAHSAVVFRSFRNELPEPLTMKRKVANSLRLLFKSSIDREFQAAVYKGERNGRKFVESQLAEK